MATHEIVVQPRNYSHEENASQARVVANIDLIPGIYPMNEGGELEVLSFDLETRKLQIKAGFFATDNHPGSDIRTFELSKKKDRSFMSLDFSTNVGVRPRTNS